MKSGISVCMIVKDEEENLKRSLSCAMKFADEVIVVDTGSSDKSVEVAESLGAKVSYYAWDNCFSNARNASLRRASHEWILWLDADDEIDDWGCKQLKNIPSLLSKACADAAMFHVQNVDLEGKHRTSFDQVRIFKNDDRIKFHGTVHESVDNSLTKNLMNVATIVDAKIIHHGYASKKLRREKAHRNLKLMLNNKNGFDASSAVGALELAESFYLVDAFSAALSSYAISAAAFYRQPYTPVPKEVINGIVKVGEKLLAAKESSKN